MKESPVNPITFLQLRYANQEAARDRTVTVELTQDELDRVVRRAKRAAIARQRRRDRINGADDRSSIPYWNRSRGRT